jgi:hypothetical protein
MQAEIDRGDRPALRRRAALSSATRPRSCLGAQRARGRLPPDRRREHREHGVADQLEHVAAGLVHRRDHRLGVVVEQRDDLLRRGAVGDRGVAAQVGEPQRRVDPSATPRWMRPLSTRWPASRPR